MGEVVIYVENYGYESGSEAICFCRICHEAEFESSNSMEAPCGCSGTVKFAHRDCIQRWCNEKGNTICEICLQKYEPGYTAPPPKMVHLVDATTTGTIRGRMEIPMIDADEENGEEHQNVETTNYSQCSSDAHRTRTASCCRSMALIFTFLLLVRHVYELVGEGAKDYPFSLSTLLILKASGIFLPMYVLVRILTLIQNSIHHEHQHSYLVSK
nr:E3 ubiquitin-protein ligase MARCH8 [Ipomoea batatas]